MESWDWIMAVPGAYRSKNMAPAPLLWLARFVSWSGISRLPVIAASAVTGTAPKHQAQVKLLVYRNLLGKAIVEEGKALYGNVELVENAGLPTQPMLLFLSDGKEIGKHWIPCQETFAQETGSEIVPLDCGHYVHHFHAEKIVERTGRFLNELRDTNGSWNAGL